LILNGGGLGRDYSIFNEAGPASRYFLNDEFVGLDSCWVMTCIRIK
jgi:hypothetical protein